MPATVLHLALGASFYPILRHKLPKIRFFPLSITLVLIDFDVIFAWLVYWIFGILPLWGFFHAPILALTLAFLIGIFYSLFKGEASVSKLSWSIISGILGALLHISFDLASKKGIRYAFPILLSENPFVFLTSFQADLIALSICFSLVAFYFYCYKRKIPLFTIEETLIAKAFIERIRLAKIALIVKQQEIFFLISATGATVASIATVIIPDLKMLYFTIALFFTSLLLIITYKLHIL